MQLSEKYKEDFDVSSEGPSPGVTNVTINIINIVVFTNLPHGKSIITNNDKSSVFTLIVEVCKSDPKPIRIRSDSFGFRNQNIHFGSDRIDKVVS
jgi:hypothetical protein